ncbi:MAG: ABC transporter ATP-binding protein [Patescibacteria group bacterium]
MTFGKLVKTYKGWTISVIVLGFAANVLALYVPKLAAKAIDAGVFSAWSPTLMILLGIAIATLIVAVVQMYVSTYLSEKVALDLRAQLIDKISRQSFQYVDESTPGNLQTVLTSDVEAVKMVISQGFVTLFGALLTLVGSAIFLLSTNLRLGLYVLCVIPLLALSFGLIFGTVSRLFKEAQENIQSINAHINETIVGSALIRVLHSTADEVRKFMTVNARSRDIGLGIVKSFAGLIPLITLIANGATLIIIWFGGKQVIAGTMTIGDFSAFLSYSAMFIWPLFVLSFVGPAISRGAVSLKRISEVIDVEIKEESGTYDGAIRGDIEFKNVSLVYKTAAGEEKTVLKDISFKINAKTKNAIVGPTAAGKSQLFYLMSGLVQPTSGEVWIDGRIMAEYKISSLLKHIGLVFQDSILFNTSIRENIAFSNESINADEALQKALQTAELTSLIKEMPQGLNTFVSERGTSLSGGQKQRLMLARALAIQPQILLLDDFTARVDQSTESLILGNVTTNYPDVTLVSITQKIEPIREYDQIIVLMEGEVVGIGRHDELLKDSFEYKQIFESQMSTETLNK